ncbi:MAG: sodium:alanine symporter family protein [Pseudomonadota bacterium]
MEDFIVKLTDFVWGGTWGDTTILPAGPVVVILLGAGLYFMLRLGFRPLRRFGPALGELWRGRKGDGSPNAITPWQALSTALSGQVGTGNLAGVATAITLGGPGAIFWMWVTAFFGMALAFAESSLAVKFRETDEYGRINGGPMYYIKNGLSKKWTLVAILFCIGTIFSAAATGGMTQSNSITQTVVRSGGDLGMAVPSWSVGAVLAVLVFAVIIGGIKSIGSVAGRVVPLMAALYVGAALIVLIMNFSAIPGAFMTIITSAFGLQEAAGGLAGYTMVMAVRFGVDRGLFSNEAGQGSAPIAHAATSIKNPVAQGEIAMIGVFIDTLVICTMTALVVLSVPGDFRSSPAMAAYDACEREGLVSLPDGVDHDDWFPGAYVIDREVLVAENGANAAELLLTCQAAAPNLVSDAAIASARDGSVDRVERAWQADLEASAVTNAAYNAALPFGGWIVTICLALFAFTTIIGWSYYAEQAITYLLGEWATHPIRYIWVGVIFVGALTEVGFVWMLGGLANASMAVPNLIAILALSSVVMAMHRKNGDPDTESGDSVILKGESVNRPGDQA